MPCSIGKYVKIKNYFCITTLNRTVDGLHTRTLNNSKTECESEAENPRSVQSLFNLFISKQGRLFSCTNEH